MTGSVQKLYCDISRSGDLHNGFSVAQRTHVQHQWHIGTPSARQRSLKLQTIKLKKAAYAIATECLCRQNEVVMLNITKIWQVVIFWMSRDVFLPINKRSCCYQNNLTWINIQPYLYKPHPFTFLLRQEESMSVWEALLPHHLPWLNNGAV